MINALSFDLEDWFMVYNFSKRYPFERWDKCESRVNKNTERILSLLKKHNTRATFFVLGYIAERYPDLIKRIYNDGHEIASHTYKHDLIYSLTPEQFNADLIKCKNILKKTVKSTVKGFRAPSFSITKKNLWAFDILKKNKFLYDSSVFPITHPDYGIPNFKKHPVKLNNGLVEAPMSTVKIFGKRIPISGGAYFRLLPFSITKKAITKLNNTYPLFFYLHPWEIDANQPRKPLPLTKKLRHYTNLSSTEAKLKSLLKNFKFDSYEEVLFL